MRWSFSPAPGRVHPSHDDKNWALSWCGRWPLSRSTSVGGISLGKDDACALEDSMHPKGTGIRMTRSGFSVAWSRQASEDGLHGLLNGGLPVGKDGMGRIGSPRDFSAEKNSPANMHRMN